MGWHLGRLAAFDLETTGVDPEEARIVEAYVARVGGGQPAHEYVNMLVNPGVEVPEEAAAIHGYTTEHLREHGENPKAAVEVVVCAVAAALQEGVPVVGHNVPYDLTVLDRECRRHGLATLDERTVGTAWHVIDTRVISKQMDKWRRRVSEQQGAHALKTSAQAFGVPWSDADAHGARYDALISARVAWRMGVIAAMPREQRPRIQAGRGDDRHLFDALAVDLPTLHARQERWAAEQAASYQEWLRSPKAREKQDSAAVISGAWPIEPAPINATQEALS